MKKYFKWAFVLMVTVAILTVALMHGSVPEPTLETSNQIENTEKTETKMEIPEEKKEKPPAAEKIKEETITPSEDELKEKSQEQVVVTEEINVPLQEESVTETVVPSEETATEEKTVQPVVEAVPQPEVLPEEKDEEFFCYLSVDCGEILNNLNLLPEEKHGILPQNGIIFPETKVSFNEGESVFHVLRREMKRAKIHFEFTMTPLFNSAYIEGINNLYEFDCGEQSGWLYSVNGEFPNYGCSGYTVKKGDKISWTYTCNFGRDVGGYYLEGEETIENGI